MTCPYGAEFTFGLTAPFNPKPGHRWADSASGILFTFVNDFDPFGQTGQWVAFGNSEVILGPTGPTGEYGPPGPPGPPGSVQDILGTENQIGVTFSGSTATIYLPSSIVATSMSMVEISSTYYYGSEMELYGSISLPYGSLNAPSGSVVSPHHEGNLRLGGIEVQVKNTSGITLSKGTPVYIVDDIAASTYVEVARSYADNYPTVPMIGLLAQDLSNNSIGYAISQGILNNINTSSMSPGSSLWVASSTSTGVTYGLTINEPFGYGNYKQRAGIVLRSHSTDGMIYVFGGDAFGKSQPNAVPFANLIGECPPQSILFNLIGGVGNEWSAVELYRKARLPSTPNYFNYYVFDFGPQGGGPLTYAGLYPGTPDTRYLYDKKFAAWDEESESWFVAQGGRGITYGIAGTTYSLELNYASPGVTGLTFATITTASTSDKVLLQRKPSDKMELITVGNLLNTAYATAPTNISGNISGYKFAFFDNSGNQYSSSESNVKSQLLGDNINSLNGCTGAVGITGTTGEVEVTQSCPNIIIGLPDNVSITGSLTVGGFYYGEMDGGTF